MNLTYIYVGILKTYVFLAVLGLRCCMQTFCNWIEKGLLSSCGVQASHRGGFSCAELKL